MSADLEDLDAPDLEDLDAPDHADDSIDLEDSDGAESAESTDGGGWTRPAFTAAHLAVAVAGALVVGFLAGKATSGPVSVAPAAAVATPSSAPPANPAPSTGTLPPYNAGTTYPAPPSPSATAAASVPTYSPGELATGNPQGFPVPHPAKATATSDPLLAGYSTRIAPWYVKMLCQPAGKGPDACLVAWEKSWGVVYPDGYKP